MDINLIVFAAPIFLILIGIELLFKSETYQFNDSINNFSAGIFEQIATLPARGLIIFGYYYIYEHSAFFLLTRTLLVLGLYFGSAWIFVTTGTIGQVTGAISFG